MTTRHARTATIARLVPVAVALLACSGALVRSGASRRPNGAEPTALPFVANGAPTRASAGAYDGANDILFDVTPGGGAAIRLFRSTYTTAGWSRPLRAIPDFEGRHTGAQVSPDRSRLYFESTRREPAIESREDTDLWVAERVGDAWGKARPLGAPFDSPHNEHNVTVSRAGTICFNSNRRGVTAGHDILCARRTTNGWAEPRPLDAGVNGPSADIEPFLDADERFIVFASNRAGGAGDFDLYISRRENGAWQPAVHLGAGVNSPASESSPAVSPDGQRLLFSRAGARRVMLYEGNFASVSPLGGR